MSRTLWFDCWILCNVGRMSEQGTVGLFPEGWTALLGRAMLDNELIVHWQRGLVPGKIFPRSGSGCRHYSPGHMHCLDTGLTAQ